MKDAIENALISLWKNILGLDDIKRDDDFFEIGGESLTVLQLVAQLKAKFKINANASTILKYPTIMKLAEFILSEATSVQSSSQSCVLCLQEGYNTQTYVPLILIHAADGDVYIYSHLVKGMPDKFPIYAIRSPLMNEKKNFKTLEKMAEFYLAELNSFGLQPPFLIGGASFGGVVAYHMAQILLHQGKDRPMVVSIDAPAYTNLPDAYDEDILIIEFLNKYMFSQLGIQNEEIRAFSSTQEQTDFIINKAKQVGMRSILPEDFGPKFISTWRQQQQLMNYYIAEPYDGDMVFFSHTEITPEFPTDQNLEWMKLVRGSFAHHKIPGNHSNMTSSPNVNTIIKHLTEIMESSFKEKKSTLQLSA